MDSITQVLLGAVTAQLGFRQRIGKDASWVAAGSALLPDLDLLAGPILSLTGVEHTDSDMFMMHRGMSHSLLLVPFLGFVIAVMWWRFRQMYNKRNEKSGKDNANPFWLLYLCVLVALFMHRFWICLRAMGPSFFPRFQISDLHLMLCL